MPVIVLPRFDRLGVEQPMVHPPRLPTITDWKSLYEYLSALEDRISALEAGS